MLFAVLFWPQYSDTHGRRKVLMRSLFATSLLFGVQVPDRVTQADDRLHLSCWDLSWEQTRSSMGGYDFKVIAEWHPPDEGTFHAREGGISMDTPSSIQL